jgi:hypothetical protein
VWQPLAARALVLRAAAAMRSRRLEAYDAFHAFDVTHAGVLTCSQLYSGLTWLQLSVTAAQVHRLSHSVSLFRVSHCVSLFVSLTASSSPSLSRCLTARGGCQQVHELVRRVGGTQQGLVTAAEFLRTFHDELAEEGAGAASTAASAAGERVVPRVGGGGGGASPAKASVAAREAAAAAGEEQRVPQRRIAELRVELNAAASPEKAAAGRAASEGTLHKVQVKLVRHNAFTVVWSSKGAGGEAAAVCVPKELEGGMLSQHKVRVCVGHYMVAAHGKPADDQCCILEVGARWATLRAGWVTLRARWATLRARWVTLRARWVTLRARWVTLRARWVTLRARWVTLRARWVTLRARWVTLRARWVTLISGEGQERRLRAIGHEGEHVGWSAG